MDGFDRAIVEITCPRSLRSPVRWLELHRSPAAKPDIGRMKGLQVSSVHRTLLDLGAVMEADAVEMALECALRRRHTSIGTLERLLIRCGGRGSRGVGTLREVLSRRPPGASPTASALETWAIQEMRRQSLPVPERQFVVNDLGRFIARVDLAFPRAHLAVEVDSRRHHADDPDWAHDLQRRNALIAAGYTVMHVTYSNLSDDIRQIGRFLARQTSGR